MHHDRQGGGYCDGWQKIWTVVEVASSKGHKWMMLIYGRDSAHNLSLKLSPYQSSWKMTVFSLHVLHEISGVLLLWFSSNICLVTITSWPGFHTEGEEGELEFPPNQKSWNWVWLLLFCHKYWTTILSQIAIWEDLNQNFPGGACPQTPLVGTHTYMYMSVLLHATIILHPPPTSKSCMKPCSNNWPLMGRYTGQSNFWQFFQWVMIFWEVLQWPGIWREGIKGGRGEGRKVRKVRRGRRGEEKNQGREMREGRM